MTVSGAGAIEPGRLAELVDGAPPRDAAEVRMSELLAAVREVEPGAPEALRLRVRAAATAPPAAGPLARLGARLRGADRRRLALVAAPAAAAIVALAVAIPVLTSGGEAPSGSAPAAGGDAAGSAQRAAPAAPEAAPADRAAPARARASARAIAIVRGLGGTTVSVDDPAGAGPVRIVFRVPAARADEAIAALGRLGPAAAVRRGAGDPDRANLATLELTLAAGAGP